MMGMGMGWNGMEWGRGCWGWEGRTAPLPPGLAPRPAPAVSTDGPAPVSATRPRGGRGRSGRRRRGGAGPGPVRSEGSRGALPARPVAASPGRTRRQLPHSPPRRGGGSRTPHPSHHPPHLGTPSPRPAPASPLPPQPSATSGPAVRAGGREERGGEPGQLPAGGARPLQHMCCHSAVPAVIVAPGRGCAMGPPLLLACLLAPLCARVRDGAGGWGALRWCWGERWGGGCGARAPMDALSRGRRGWGFGGTVAFLTL